jgi:hypothetical protein
MTRQKLIAGFLAGLLVLAPFGGLALAAAPTAGSGSSSTSASASTTIVPTAQSFSPVGTAEASHDCDFRLYVGLSATLDLTKEVSECLFHGDRSTDSIDHSQTRTELVQRAATGFEHAEVELTSLENNLENTRAVARLEMQAAYYRALENGSSESAARATAKQAVRDYYTVKQEQLVSSWNILITSMWSYEKLENNESLAEGFVASSVDGSLSGGNFQTDDQYSNPYYDLSAVNGSQLSSATWLRDYGGGKNWRYLDGHNLGPSDRRIAVGWNNDSVSDVASLKLARYQNAWTDIENQSEEVLADADTYINNTYDSYQSGDVNASQLVDANTLTREFTGNNTQSWSTLALSTTSGVDPPENLDGVGTFEVEYQDTIYTGILLADTQERSVIESGQTYNGSLWTVTPKLVTDSDRIELDGEFTIRSITNDAGETVGNVTYREVSYETTNTSDYQTLMSELDALRSELETREEQQQSGGLFGGLFGGGGLGLYGGIAVAAVLLFAVYASGAVGGKSGEVDISLDGGGDLADNVRDRKGGK